MKPHQKHILALAAATALLAACGGGDDDTAPNDPPVPEELNIGDEYSVIVSSGEQVLRDETRKIYGVTTDGTLTDDPASPKLVIGATPSLPVAQGEQRLPDLRPEIERFLGEFFQVVVGRYGPLQPEMIWAQLEDQGVSLDQVYEDFQRSGLSVAEFVAFYHVIDEQNVSGIDGREELDVVRFLRATGLTQRQLLDMLVVLGTDWPNFVGTVVSRNENFQTLLMRWDNRPLPQSPAQFLSTYLAEPAPKALEQTKNAGAAQLALEAAKLQFEVAKFAWKVIEDGRPSIEAQGLNTSILSKADTHGVNYEHAVVGQTNTKEVVICTRVLSKCIKDWAKVEFRLSGTYKAVNPRLLGHWLPAVNLETPTVWAFWGQNVNVSAYITNLSNLGSAAAPKPYAEIVAEMSVRGKITSDKIQVRFAAHGENGFSIPK